LASVGARVVICGRDVQRLEETRAMLPGDGHATVASALATVEDGAELMRSTAKEHGPLDGVFHAAGVSLTLPVRLTKQAHVDDVFGPSVHAAFGIARGAGQKGVMQERSALVFMSSISAERGHNGMMVYSGAKAAVHGLVRSAAVELAAKGVRVNAIIAGAVYTEMYAREVERMGPDWIAGVGAKHPLGFGETDDISNTVLFLLSDAGKWITGTTMTVDGGYTAQ
jgi:NAD(P)-dependent dehydrogenase (short-subunit alcohol dehydrogenase family)